MSCIQEFCEYLFISKNYNVMNLATNILLYFQLLVTIVAAVYNHVELSSKGKETFKGMAILGTRVIYMSTVF